MQLKFGDSESIELRKNLEKQRMERSKKSRHTRIRRAFRGLTDCRPCKGNGFLFYADRPCERCDGIGKKPAEYEKFIKKFPDSDDVDIFLEE